METRKVGQDGSIKYKGKKYLGKQLMEHLGKTLEIRPILKVSVLWVFDDAGKFICEAREEGVSFEESFGIVSKEQNRGNAEMFGRKKLEEYKTDELIKELAKRYGVSIVKIREGCQYNVKGNGSRIKEEGPATIFVARG